MTVLLSFVPLLYWPLNFATKSRYLVAFLVLVITFHFMQIK